MVHERSDRLAELADARPAAGRLGQAAEADAGRQRTPRPPTLDRRGPARRSASGPARTGVANPDDAARAPPCSGWNTVCLKTGWNVRASDHLDGARPGARQVLLRGVRKRGGDLRLGGAEATGLRRPATVRCPTPCVCASPSSAPRDRPVAAGGRRSDAGSGLERRSREGMGLRGPSCCWSRAMATPSTARWSTFIKNDDYHVKARSFCPIPARSRRTARSRICRSMM